MIDITPGDIRKYLSSHGHAFQYAVLRRWHDLTEKNVSKWEGSDWMFVASEFPVGLQQNTIHIDFILRSRDSRVYLVAECKRADPARANWCFVKAPYTRSNAFVDELVFQEVEYGLKGTLSKPRESSSPERHSYHLGFELRTGVAGEGKSGGGSAINDATAQVLRAMNGLVDHLFKPTSSVGDRGRLFFLPVIFTTATLWTTEGDLGAADLMTGRLPDDWGEVKKVEYLWFNYNQSPMLRHQLPYFERSVPGEKDLSRTLYAEYTRSIAVVGYNGIDSFFRSRLVDWLTP